MTTIVYTCRKTKYISFLFFFCFAWILIVFMIHSLYALVQNSGLKKACERFWREIRSQVCVMVRRLRTSATSNLHTHLLRFFIRIFYVHGMWFFFIMWCALNSDAGKWNEVAIVQVILLFQLIYHLKFMKQFKYFWFVFFQMMRTMPILINRGLLLLG